MNTDVQAHPNTPLPLTPEDAERVVQEARRAAWKAYRKSTRPFRRTFRGIISRRDAERFAISRARKTTRAIEAAEEQHA